MLQSAATYAFNPDGLLFLHGDQGTLRLLSALTGVRWEWEQFQGGDDTIVQSDDPSQYSVMFLPDGTLAIQNDGHPTSGTYTVDHSTIDLRIDEVPPPVASTGAQTDRFLRDLDQVASHVFRDGKLYLALPADAGILTFAPVAVAHPDATPVAG